MLPLLLAAVPALVVPTGTRSLGTLSVSEAGIGTLNLALDKSVDPAAAEALKAAIDAGCNFVDTADRYA